MLHTILCIVTLSAFCQISVTGEDILGVKKPEPVPTLALLVPPVHDKITETSLPVAAPPSKPVPLRLTLTSVDISKNLWREDEKGQLFQVIRVPEPENELTTPHHEEGCLHHVQDILFPKGQSSHDLGSRIPSQFGHPIRRYIKDRAGRTFWPFTNWYYDDPCYYGGPGCYPPPYPGPYYPPPPSPYY